MKLSWTKYTVLAAVFLGSAFITWVLRDNGSWQGIVAIPGVLSLIGVIYQLVRDEAAHIRAMALQQDRQRFDLGITSHMADVTFDKHVAFCEEYVAELNATLTTLWRDGTSVSALSQANKLLEIRRKHTLWITPAIESRLELFDKALRQIGALAHFYASNSAAASSSGRMKQMYDNFTDVLGIPRLDGEVAPNADIAITSIMEHARSILGVNRLIDLRRDFLERERNFLTERGQVDSHESKL